MPTASDTARLTQLLQHYWGYDSFRPHQEQAISQVVGGGDCLLVLPTGGGKSLCYQLPALVRDGLTVVVSPLIALMDDQVAAAQNIGIAAAALHSQRSPAERQESMREARSGRLRLLYISPERLLIGDILPQVRDHCCLVAVDEAHCVSHWGHDFRPEYRQLHDAFAQLDASIPRMALTATATPEVQRDMVHYLGLRDPAHFVGHPDRANLMYRSIPRRRVAEQIAQVAQRHPEGGGIVYALTRKEVEKLAQELRSRGIDAQAYHAGMEADHRRRVQQDFVDETVPVVVATVAFGMGIDRSNVRWVVHAGCPRSLEHYQQESGRAGRDGLPAECVLLFGAGDLATHRHFIDVDAPPPDRRQALEDQLRAMARFATTPVCRHQLLSEYFGAIYPPPGQEAQGEAGCGACDVCLGETTILDDAMAEDVARKLIAVVWHTKGGFGLAHVVAVALGRNTVGIRRHRHDQLSVHGILSHCDEATLRTWLDQLIVQGLLYQERSDGFALLRMSQEGKTLCRDGGRVRLSQPQHRKGRKAAGGEARSTGSSQDVDEAAWQGVDKGLFDALRSMRMRIAKADGVPPYVIFHDTTLRELARVAPTQLWELEGVKGVGQRKSERYGAAVIATVQEYQGR
ncbi:MAG: DNA helicase RecQ [Planctomycetota bacterium]|nr:MAG: DNA helicase RecQ [Planctomycetota bacterium]